MIYCSSFCGDFGLSLQVSGAVTRLTVYRADTHNIPCRVFVPSRPPQKNNRIWYVNRIFLENGSNLLHNRINSDEENYETRCLRKRHVSAKHIEGTGPRGRSRMDRRPGAENDEILILVDF